MIVAAQVLMVVALVAAAWFAPRAFAGIGLVGIVCSPTLAVLTPGFGAGYLDEAVVVVAVVVLTARRGWSRRWPRVPAWSLWFAGFFAAGILSAILRSVPAPIALEGSFLAVKGILLGLAVAQVDWRVADLRRFITGGAVTTIVVAAFFVPNLIAPGPWSAALAERPRGFPGAIGLPALIGPFTDPAALGRLCALLAIAALAYRLCVGGGWFSWLVLALATFGALASFRVKTYVSLVAAVITVGALSLRRLPRWVLIVAGVVAVAAALPLYQFVAHDVNLYILSTSARSRLTVGAVDVANAYAPWGAGFGRYGSFTASAHYSPEYLALGFDSVRGLGSAPGTGNYLNDTQWPAILGETGWLGATLFAAGLLHLCIRFFRPRPAERAPMFQWLRLTGIGWLVVVVVESIAAPVFTSAPSYPFVFVAAGVYAALTGASGSVPGSELQDLGDHDTGAEKLD